jgi:AraC family transcriptional regulator, regulatory protein of adaptative response / DNA-3-methyladenine glycosylase II
MGVCTLHISATSPFDGESLLEFLAARAVAGVEEVMGGSYRRSVLLKNGAGVVCVRPDPAGVTVELERDGRAEAGEALARVRRLFALDADPAPAADALGRDELLGPLVRSRPGLRVPGAWDGFETAVRAIVGQQVSVTGARTVLGRIAETYGGFPAAGRLADADPSSFPFPRARGQALVDVARLVASGELRLDPDADRHEARARLLAVPGIGPWTASYIALRALGDPDVFLDTDAGVRRALARLDPGADPDRWRPWRSYAVVHLWRSLAP